MLFYGISAATVDFLSENKRCVLGNVFLSIEKAKALFR